MPVFRNCDRDNIDMTVSIDIVFKIAAIGILIAVLNQLLSRAGKDDIALMTSIAGLVIVLLMVVDLISNLFDSVKSIFGLYCWIL